MNTAVLPYREKGHNLKKKKEKSLLKGYPKSFIAKGKKASHLKFCLFTLVSFIAVISSAGEESLTFHLMEFFSCCHIDYLDFDMDLTVGYRGTF